MTKNKIGKENGREIIADIISRPNAKIYNDFKLGLNADDLIKFKNNSFYLESMRMKANYADKIIAEAMSQGLDMNDGDVRKQLCEKINLAGKPILKSKAVMNAFFVSGQLIILFGVVLGIWGLVFDSSILTFFIYGSIVGLILSMIFVAPAITIQRTKERIQDLSYGARNILGWLGLVLGVFGVLALIIKQLFL